jgi:hypothetical protein
MFARLFLRGECVVALPRRATKTAAAVAFALADGRELAVDALAAQAPDGDGDRVRLDSLSSPVGWGPSQPWLRAGWASEPLRTLELPDADLGGMRGAVRLLRRLPAGHWARGLFA